MKIRKAILSFLLLVSLNSCNYLDIVPDNTPVLEDAFKNETTAEGFVFSCYGKIPNYLGFRYNNWITTPEMVAAPHWTVQWFPFVAIQQSVYNPSNPVVDVWQSSYDAIRQCYLFLSNIDNVTPIRDTPEVFEEKKRVWKAEVQCLIAYYHFLLLQNYGPIVIVDHLIEVDASKEEMAMPRLPFDECVEKILAMFDKAIPDLPATVNDANLGRLTKVIAEALKAKMLLYAASPQFNGNADYKDFTGKDGTPLVSVDYDPEKWKRAYEQCWKAISLAEDNGIKLYEYAPNEGEIGKMTPRDQAIANCRNVVTDPWNSELIWGYSGWKEVFGDGNSIQTHMIPKGISTSNGAPFGGLGATLWSADLFLTENALPIDKDPAFHYDERFKIPEGETEIPYLHRNREPRFYAAIGFDDGEYRINGDTIKLELKYKEKNGLQGTGFDHLYGGYAIAKLVNPNSFVSLTSNSLVTYPFPIIRLAELYLSYAEAFAEYNGTLSGEAEKCFNMVRRRAGLPDISVSHPGVQGRDLVEVVRREKTVEFMYEGQMLYDYRRWKIADKEWGGMEKGMLGLNANGSTAEDFYKPVLLDKQPFVFRSYQLLSPIKQDYINKNSKLVQNPGW